MGSEAGGKAGAGLRFGGGNDVFDVCGIALAEIEPNGSVVRLNPAMIALLGDLAADSAVSRSLWHFVASESMARIKDAISCALDGEATNVEANFVIAAGRQTPVNVCASALHNGHVLLSAVPTGEYRETTRALQRSVELYQRIVETATEGIWIADAQWRITFVNRHMALMLGMDPEEIIGRPMMDFLPPDGTDRLRAACVPGNASDMVIKRANQSMLPVLVSAAPLVDAEGRLDGMLALVTDITALTQNRAAARETELRRMEARRLESLGMLAGGIAHDFNNLLVGIIGGAGLAEVELEPDSPAHPHLKLINDTANRAAILTRQMLAFSGHGHVTMEGLDLSRVISREMTALEALASEHGCKLTFALSDNLPRAQGDKHQLMQVLRALIANACEANDDKHRDIEVRTRCVSMRQHDLDSLLPPEPRTEGEYVVLEVRDHGTGVLPADRSRLFDPFFTTRESGRGLGLAASLGIVRGHRGFIGVDSATGGGALFRVGLPARTDGRNSTIRDEETMPDEVPGTGVILIADDEEMVRHVTRTILQRVGYEVVEARDGLEAVELFEDNASRISMVLLDLSMPRMGGREALIEIRSRNPNLPILLMSGYPEAEALVGFRPRDLAGFVQKPFRAEQLRNAVTAIVAPPC